MFKCIIKFLKEIKLQTIEEQDPMKKFLNCWFRKYWREIRKYTS